MGREEAYGDDVYQPSDDGALDHTGELDMEDALDEPDADQLLDSGYSPPEKPRACGRFGETAEEQLRGESLEQRMAQEEPEATLDSDVDHGDEDRSDDEDEWDDDAPGGPRAGRLMFMDTDGQDGEHWHLVGRDVGIDGGAASAEEAAMHIVER